MATPSPVEFARLTGRPSVRSGPVESPFVPDKRYQLLAYLAYHGEWLGRERVAFMFWPDTDTANSRQNLRGLLQRLRSLPFLADVESTPHSLRWAPQTDVNAFRQAVLDDLVDTAIDAYHGPLLSGLEEGGAGEFGDWLEIERGRLHSEWRAFALRRLRECKTGEQTQATSLLRRLLEHDELDEEAVRTCLVTMRRLGAVDEARSLYQTFASRLAEELELEPTSETVKAYEALESVESQPVAQRSQADSAHSAKAVRRLPVPTTSFLGRESELARLRERLRDPDSRLLTVVGAGGAGKTRLALAAAHASAPDFEDGAAFVPLDAIDTVDEVPRAVLGALGIPASGGDEAARLRTVLAGMTVLLVLDNCEHLDGIAGLVATLLADGPGVKVLATSRQRLGLGHEQLFPLSGLAFPTAADTFEAAVTSNAIALFLDRARRVRPTFAVDPREAPTLARLGAYTEGLPLAIELAAAWARALPLKEIVDSIGESLDLLANTAVDGIPRHASIRATFEQSWSTLSAIEQGVMRRLAVFAGPITGDAARFVAGASRVVLAVLVDKSLLRLGDDGRYHRHPLLLAFTREKLAAEPVERDATVRRHASYYLRFLRERTDRARGARPAEALNEIENELVEILAATESARQRGKNAQLIAFMRLLAVDTGYLPAKGFGPRRLELLLAAAEAAKGNEAWEAAHLLVGRVADAYGTHSDEHERAQTLYREAASLAARCGNVGRQAVYLSMQGVMTAKLAAPGADGLLDEALALASRSGEDLSLATVLEHRAYVYGIRGDHDASRELYQRSLEAAERLLSDGAAEPLEVRRLRFYGLLNLGEMEWLLDRPELALATRQRALEVAEQSGNPIWIAHAALELGEMHAKAENHETARNYLLRAQEYYRQNHVTANLERIGALLEGSAAASRRGV